MIQAPVSCPVESLGTTLSRVRCNQPLLVDRMVKNLSAHGQLTPLVAVEQSGRMEIIDGFKRHRAAQMMSWESLAVRVVKLDETTQWATMLALNRSSRSITELEEALILQELIRAGLTQVQVAQIVQRHKSWVSRRVGLVERLHPELIEGMKLGVLHPGVARRLLPLPQGNQLKLAAAAQNASLGPRDTELLVSLWQQASNQEVRSYLLSHPKTALKNAHPEVQKQPVDPRLCVQSQRLQRMLRLLSSVAPKTAELLQAPPPIQDMTILESELASATAALSRLMKALGSLRSGENDAVSDESDETSSS